MEPWQIHAWQLPTRPTKATDSRSKGFVGESVEVDAIPPQALRDLGYSRIMEHLGPEALYHLELAEASQREILLELAAVAEGRE